MSQGFYGFPNILDIVRATTLKAVGKAGATNGAALAGGTASGAPTSGGPFDKGDVIVDATGSLWICTTAGTSQSSPGSFTQVGTLVDPLTTRGDIIRRGASATQRLALGSANQVLQSDGTDALWGAAPPGGGGALTQLATTTLGSTTASITFSSIPGSYSALQVILQARGDTSAANAGLCLQFNGDTAANYDYSYMWAFQNAAPSANFANATANPQIGLIAANTAPANQPGSAILFIPNYAGTTFRKEFDCVGAMQDSDTARTFTVHQSGTWRSTAAITSIKLYPAAGSFVTGSVAVLYGLS